CSQGPKSSSSAIVTVFGAKSDPTHPYCSINCIQLLGFREGFALHRASLDIRCQHAAKEAQWTVSLLLKN
ncbi:MAG: hypothetical protein ACM3QS_09195, partial [Bacteroidota bacterium]